MNPYEQRLQDEVLYLHSLWRQGPPTNPNRNPNPNLTPTPIPTPTPTAIPLHIQSRQHLQPINPPQFKRIAPTRSKKNPAQSDPPPVSDVEWPCKSPAATTPPTNSGWPIFKPHPKTPIPVPSPQEQAKHAANQVQQNALKASQAFFAGNVDSDDDGDGDMVHDDDVLADQDCEEHRFFLKVFMEDDELRKYYEKSNENGDFCCLVCGGIGKKVGKRFINCVALIHHSIQIANTKKRRAHRAFGQVICKVLGWNVDRLPHIVLSLGDSLGHALTKSSQTQGNVINGKDHSDLVNNGELIPLKVADVSQKEPVEVKGVGSSGSEMTKNNRDIIVFDGENEIMTIRVDKEVVEVVTTNTNGAK